MPECSMASFMHKDYRSYLTASQTVSRRFLFSRHFCDSDSVTVCCSIGQKVHSVNEM